MSYDYFRDIWFGLVWYDMWVLFFSDVLLYEILSFVPYTIDHFSGNKRIFDAVIEVVCVLNIYIYK